MTNNTSLLLTEKRNAIDFLIQSLIFLSQVEQNPFYQKWFIISFHGALHSFMVLVLQSFDSKLIYEKFPLHFSKPYDSKKDFKPSDGKLLGFKPTYAKLLEQFEAKGITHISNRKESAAINELNDSLRNQMVHFKPMAWMSSAWYPAGVCLPLLNLLKTCINYEKNGFTTKEKKTCTAYIGSIEVLLLKHSSSEDE